MGGVGVGLSAVTVLLLLAAPALGASTTALAQKGFVEHFAGPTAPSGGGKVTRCAGQTAYGGFTNSVGAVSGWICDVTKVTGAIGKARGVDALDGITAKFRGVSGTYTFAGLGNLSMPAGWAKAHVACGSSANQSGAASAEVYVLYAVWLTDTVSPGVSTSYTADISYVWDSGTISCSTSGSSATIASPGLTGAFNTSNFGGGAFSYTFVASHTYQFVIKIGCTGTADVTAFQAGTSAKAWCDSTDSQAASITLNSVVLY
jgi:hypothetical protein